MKFVSAARLYFAVVIACAAPIFQGAAAAADAVYPAKPIRLIVPFSPGGTNDILARTIATHLTDALGKTVIVDNRAGAEGIIGTEIVVKAAPDGYTLILLSAAYVMNPALRKLPYDPLTALDFISKLGSIATTAGTPPAIIKRLYTLIADYLLMPETQKRLTAVGAEIDVKPGKEFSKTFPADIAKWTKVAIAAGTPRE